MTSTAMTLDSDLSALIPTMTADELRQQLSQQGLRAYQRVELVMQLWLLLPDLSRSEIAKMARFGESTLQRGMAVAKAPYIPESIKTDLRQGTRHIETIYKTMVKDRGRKGGRAARAAKRKKASAALMSANLVGGEFQLRAVAKVTRDIELVKDESLTLLEIATRLKVITKEDRHRRERVLLRLSAMAQRSDVVVTQDDECYTVHVVADISNVAVELKRRLANFRLELTQLRKANNDDREKRRWNPWESNQHEFRRQLNWVEDQLDQISGMPGPARSDDTPEALNPVGGLIEE